jgi:hypothetical protein
MGHVIGSGQAAVCRLGAKSRVRVVRIRVRIRIRIRVRVRVMVRVMVMVRVRVRVRVLELGLHGAAVHAFRQTKRGAEPRTMPTLAA